MTFRTLGLAFAILAVSACGPAPSLSVQRVDVTLGVRPDGAIDVRETLAVQFESPDATHFERRVALERADSFRFESASIDGTRIEPGSQGSTTLDVNDRRDLRVVWTFPPSSATRVFDLVYRANGAVAVRGNRGTIRHVAVPAGRAYRIERATVNLAVDPDMHQFEGAGIAEADWTVSRTRDGIAGERTGLAPTDGATVMAEVGIDPAVIAEPSWQRYGDWTRDLIPAFVSGGLFILIIGGGVLWIVTFQYPRRKVGTAPLTATEVLERTAVRTGLRTSGLVAVVLSLVLAVVTWLTLSHFGWWPMSLPVSILAVGLVFVAIARRFV